MKSKLRCIATDKRVLILIIAIVIAAIAINPNPWRTGVTIKSVEKGSAADLFGVRPGEQIMAIDSNNVKTLEDFVMLTKNLEVNDTLLIETKTAFYKLTVQPELRNIILPELEEKNAGNKTVLVNKTRQEVIGAADLGITAAERSKTNIKTGLDLQGGTRVLLQPQEKVSETDLELLIENMNRRLNLFGLSDVTVRDASDFAGQQYIMVEVAALNEDELKDLIARQGKFEAKIANATVFRGTDILDVCRSAECSGLDYRAGGCQPSSPSEWFCPFFFSITLSQESAQRQ